MPVAVRDIVAHVASQETPARSIDAFVRSVADAVGGLATRADVAALQRDLLANIGPMNAAVAHDPRLPGSVAPVGVAPAIVVPPPNASRPTAPGARRDDATGVPGAWVGPSAGDVPTVFAEIKAEIAALASKVEALAGVVSTNMPLVQTGPDNLPPTEAKPIAANGPVDAGS